MKSNNKVWMRRKIIHLNCIWIAGATAFVCMFMGNTGLAYLTYTDEDAGGCKDCHLDFRGPYSTKGSTFPSDDKHEMHKGSGSMNTDCNLCHFNPGDDPYMDYSKGTSDTPGLGCIGCHDGPGLRAHHAANSVTECAGCHMDDPPPAEENVNPPYYGSPDTKANNACNDALASNTNENWTVGDYLGLDNDGDNLYDLADYSCGPLKVIDVVPEGNDMRVSWETAKGRSERLQATSNLTNSFTNVASSVGTSGVGIVTQEVVEVNGAVDPQRFFRVRSDP